jgi:hypothetical protein
VAATRRFAHQRARVPERWPDALSCRRPAAPWRGSGGPKVEGGSELCPCAWRTFGIDANRDTLCYNLQVKRIAELDLAPGNGRAAHIHAGKRGANGPVVANLAWPQGGQSADCLDGINQPARFVMANTGFATPAALIADILANPENYYVNVHNTQYPGGAVRGQLGIAHD